MNSVDDAQAEDDGSSSDFIPERDNEELAVEEDKSETGEENRMSNGQYGLD